MTITRELGSTDDLCHLDRHIGKRRLSSMRKWMTSREGPGGHPWNVLDVRFYMVIWARESRWAVARTSRRKRGGLCRSWPQSSSRPMREGKRGWMGPAPSLAHPHEVVHRHTAKSSSFEVFLCGPSAALPSTIQHWQLRDLLQCPEHEDELYTTRHHHILKCMPCEKVRLMRWVWRSVCLPPGSWTSAWPCGERAGRAEATTARLHLHAGWLFDAAGGGGELEL